MITRDDIVAADARIAPHIRATPVIEIEAGGLSEHAVALKLELFQHTGSFKARGAFNALLASDVPEAGVVAISGGNHGAAVAFAATRLGIRSTIFAPEIAGPTKIARMRGFGADVVVGGGDLTEIMDQYQAFAADTGALAIHPYDFAPVIAGQGTIGRDLERQLPDLDTLLVSVGGGGLIAGIGAWVGRRVRLIAVETEGTPTLATGLREGPEVQVAVSGIAASSLGGPYLGRLAYDILQGTDVTPVQVSDDAVCEAQSRLWDAVRIVGEPGAATALAALTSGAYRPKADERVGVLICGGNAEPGWFLD